MRKIIVFAVMMCYLSLCHVRAQGVHWQCDVRNFQYDMTMYVELCINGSAVTASDDYEIAAFCGNECRGVASVESIEGTDKTYYYLRVRSNVAEDEDITFKCYSAKEQKEFALNESVVFASQSVLGFPSAPYVLTNGSVLMGDVNNDKVVSVTDLTMTVNYILNNNPQNFDFGKGDMNGDGAITVSDLTSIVSKILKGETDK